MIVVKFGGSSLADAQRIKAAAHIVARHKESVPVIGVVSAMAGVTDKLLTIASLVVKRSSAWREMYTDLRGRHEQTLAALLPAGNAQPVTLAPLWRAFEADIATLSTFNAGRPRNEAVDVFSAWGERLSVRLFQAALAFAHVQATSFEDAPVIVDSGSRAGSAPLASVSATGAWLRDPMTYLLRSGMTPVLPGYLALTEDGRYTTLGRNGSDHSAAIIGAALDASAVYLYSNVAGIHEADPRAVPTAKLIPALTYDEASAIAAAGARVLHPATLPPLAHRGIPLFLRSSFDPSAPGTDIGTRGTQVRSIQAGGSTPFYPSLTAADCATKIGRPDAF